MINVIQVVVLGFSSNSGASETHSHHSSQHYLNWLQRTIQCKLVEKSYLSSPFSKQIHAGFGASGLLKEMLFCPPACRF